MQSIRRGIYICHLSQGNWKHLDHVRSLLSFYSWVLCFSPLKELTIWKNLDMQPRKQEPFILSIDISICSGEGVKWGEWVGNYSLWWTNKSVSSKKDGSWPSSTDIRKQGKHPIFHLNNPLQHNKWLHDSVASVSGIQWRATPGCPCSGWTICCVGPCSWASTLLVLHPLAAKRHLKISLQAKGRGPGVGWLCLLCSTWTISLVRKLLM